MTLSDEKRRLLLAKIDRSAAKMLEAEKAKLLGQGMPYEDADFLAGDLVATWWSVETSESNLEFLARLETAGQVPDEPRPLQAVDSNNVVAFPSRPDLEPKPDVSVDDLSMEELRKAAVAAVFPDGVPSWMNKQIRDQRLNDWLEAKGAPAQSTRNWRRVFNEK